MGVEGSGLFNVIWLKSIRTFNFIVTVFTASASIRVSERNASLYIAVVIFCAQPYLKPCFMCPFYILSTCPSKGLCTAPIASLYLRIASLYLRIARSYVRIASLYLRIASLYVRIASLYLRIASLYVRIASLCQNCEFISQNCGFISQNCEKKSQNCEIKRHNYLVLFFIQWWKRASKHICIKL